MIKNAPAIRLRFLLRIKKINKAQLAYKLNLSHLQISEWMDTNKRSTITMRHLPHLCKTLGISVSWLVTGQNNACFKYTCGVMSL